MTVKFPAIIFPQIIETLTKIRDQELRGDINYGLTRILKALEPEWQAFKVVRDPLVVKLKDNQEELKKQYIETFKDNDIVVEIKQAIKEEWLESMKLFGNDGNIIDLFIAHEEC